jgi:hypothetical protein
VLPRHYIVDEVSVLVLSFSDGIMEGNEEFCVSFTSLVG